jgi:membrane protease YdiL (CAAX protease family)
MSAPPEPAAHGSDIAQPGEAPPAIDRAAARALWLTAWGVLGLWAAHNALLLPWEARNIDADLLEPALIALRALTWLVPSVLYLRRYDPRHPLVALGVTTRLNARGLAWSLLVAAVYLVAIGVLVRATSEPLDENAASALLAPLHLLYMALKAALEELLMRGFLLGQLSRSMRSARAQACVVILFALMHWPAWVAFQGIGIGLLPSTIVALLLGTVLGFVARASNSILPATVVHLANNLLGELLGGG